MANNSSDCFLDAIHEHGFTDAQIIERIVKNTRDERDRYGAVVALDILKSREGCPFCVAHAIIQLIVENTKR